MTAEKSQSSTRRFPREAKRGGVGEAGKIGAHLLAIQQNAHVPTCVISFGYFLPYRVPTE